MAVGDFRKGLKLPGATVDELAAGPPLEPREIVAVEGQWGQLRIGDGTTVGGVPIAGTGGTGTGSAIAFKTIAVKGSAPETYINADQENDTLTISPLRGLVAAPIPGSDELGLGFPDGGVFQNVWTWVGNTWAPNPVPPVAYEPQPGEIPVDYLVEGDRKVWDGWLPLETYLPETNPAGTVSYGGATFPTFGATATNLLRARKRIPMNAYTGLSVVVRGQCTAASGDVQMVARLALITDLTATPTFEADAIGTIPVPASGLFDVEIPLEDIGAAVQGDTVILEFGRLGGDAADTCTGDIIVDEAWLRLL